jgi:hypothetical protein
MVLVPSGLHLPPTQPLRWMTILHRTMMLIYYRYSIQHVTYAALPLIPLGMYLSRTMTYTSTHYTLLYIIWGYIVLYNLHSSFFITMQVKSIMYFYKTRKEN